MKKKKRRIKKKNVTIAFLILAIIIISIGGLICYNKYQNKLDSKKEEPKKEIKKEEPKVTSTSFDLVMVGDNIIHSSVYKDANKHANYNGYDFKPIISHIKEVVKNYDVAYYNQESILGGTELGLNDYPTFNSPYEAGDAMVDAGFNLVSLATNHTMDSGEKATLNSRAYWNKQANVLAVGSYSSEEERNNINIKEANGITYTMLNYTYGTNGMPVPKGKDYLVNVWPTDLNLNDPERDTEYQEYKNQVKKDIEAVRDKVDVLIVAMHWGVEYVTEPTEYQKDQAKFLADNGVDIIIGTHPHIIQPVTWIDDTIVFYSLGNFLSAQYQNENYNKTVGLMSSLTVTKETKNKKSTIKIENVKNDLIYNYYNQSAWRGFKVIPFTNNEIKNYLPNYTNVYNTYKDVVQLYDKSMVVTPIN